MPNGEKFEKVKEATHIAKDKAKEFMGSATETFRKLKESPGAKSIEPLTWLGIAIAVLFLVFMAINAANLRWWLMLPLGAGGLVLLWKRRTSATQAKKALEAKVCLVTFVSLAVLLLLRDVWLSHSLAKIYSEIPELGGALEELKKVLSK